MVFGQEISYLEFLFNHLILKIYSFINDCLYYSEYTYIAFYLFKAYNSK